jgi:hypothetical protein
MFMSLSMTQFDLEVIVHVPLYFECISFGVKTSFKKNFITARYSILSILRDRDNTRASDSCIKQTT